MKGLLFAVLMVLLASQAWAAVEIVEDTITLAVDYNDFRDDRQRTIAETVSFTLRNTGSTESNASVTITGFPSSSYTVETKPVTLAAGASQTTTLQVQVPHLKGNGKETVGTLVASVAGVQADTAVVEQVTTNMLELSKIEVEYTDEKGNTQHDSFSEDDSEFVLEDNVQVGSPFTLKFTIENHFDSHYDSDKSTLERIELTADAENDVFGDDFENNYDFDDLDAEDSEELTLDLKIDDQADDDTYTVELTLEGVDGEGTRYRIDRDLKLEVKRQQNDVRIVQARLTPAAPTTCDATVSLDVELENFGTRDQDFAALKVENAKLGVEENIAPLPLDRHGRSGDTLRRTVPLDIEDAAVGTYPLRITVFYNGDKVSDDDVVDLVVGKCSTPPAPQAPLSPSGSSSTTGAIPAATSAPSSTASAGGTAAAGASPAPAPAVTSSAPIIQTTERSYSANDFLLGSMIVMMVLLVAMIGLFLVILTRR